MGVPKFFNGARTCDPKNPEKTTHNVVIPISAEHYRNVRQFALSGWDPEVPKRMIREALNSTGPSKG